MTKTETPFFPITPAGVRALRAVIREAVEQDQDPFVLLEGSLDLQAHLEQLMARHGNNPEVIEQINSGC